MFGSVAVVFSPREFLFDVMISAWLVFFSRLRLVDLFILHGFGYVATESAHTIEITFSMPLISQFYVRSCIVVTYQNPKFLMQYFVLFSFGFFGLFRQCAFISLCPTVIVLSIVLF